MKGVLFANSQNMADLYIILRDGSPLFLLPGPKLIFFLVKKTSFRKILVSQVSVHDL